MDAKFEHLEKYRARLHRTTRAWGWFCQGLIIGILFLHLVNFAWSYAAFTAALSVGVFLSQEYSTRAEILFLLNAEKLARELRMVDAMLERVGQANQVDISVGKAAH